MNVMERIGTGRFHQPENFDKVAEGAGWVMYAGGNDWENGITGICVTFTGNEQLERLWVQVKHKHDPDAESSEHADETKAWGQKAWHKWKQVAAVKHREMKDRTPSWKEAFKAALEDSEMKPFIKECGKERTQWNSVKENACRVVNRLLEDDPVEPEDVRSEVDRLLPTKTYRLGGNSMFHAPGVIHMAQNEWRVGRKKQKTWALNLVKIWPGLPDAVYLKILNGECQIEADGDAAVVTVKNY